MLRKLNRTFRSIKWEELRSINKFDCRVCAEIMYLIDIVEANEFDLKELVVVINKLVWCD